jgi:outer membrane protein assembly factor BamB
MRRKFGLALLALLMACVPFLTAFSPVSAAPASFADVGFKNTWERVDKAVDEIPNVGRGFVWGPQTIFSGTETYNGNQRTIQYFDKARMEVNNPNGNRNDLFFVTTGLLVKELVTGLQQDGDTAFSQKNPSNIQIAGDPNESGGNAVAPTYESFKNVVTFVGDENAAQPRNGQVLNQGINKAGLVSTVTPQENRTVGGYDAVTKHNIADVFITYGQVEGLIWNGSQYLNGSVFFNNPTYVFGRPVTEPYWIQAQVAGVNRNILVQLFERRVLTYTPDNQPKDRVEMGNVGQHYYKWRYNTNQPPPPPAGITDFTQFRAPYNKSGAKPAGQTAANVISYPLGAAIDSSPVVDGNVAYIGADTQGLKAVNLGDSPTTKWTYTAPSGVANFSAVPSYANNTVYIGSTTGRVFAVDVSGSNPTTKWVNTTATGRVYGAPITDGSIVVFTSYDRKVYAVGASDNSPRWQTPALDGQLVAGAIFGSDGTIYVATATDPNVPAAPGNKVYALTKDGQNKSGWTAPTLDGNVIGTPSFANNTIYVGTTNGTLYALNTNGTIRSQKTFTAGQGIYTTPAIAGGRVYVGTDDGRVYGVDANNIASIQWTVNIGAFKVRSSVAAVDGFIYFAADNKRVYQAEANNQANIVSLLNADAGEAFGGNSPVVANGRVYIGNADQKFYIIK